VTRGFRVSLAIPVHNEESAIPELLGRVCAILDKIPGADHEIIFVNDGSSDNTMALLEEAAEKDPRITVLALSRNFGHQAALSAALDSVTGDVTVIMDADLQDIPEAIPLLISKYFEGYDVVYAKRTGRKESWPLRLCYFAFYRLLSKLSDVHLPLDAGDFGLMSRRVVEQILRMPEHHRYLRGMRSWVGFRQIGVPIERAQRHSGESKYSFVRLLKLASDGLFAFSILPIRAASLLGFVTIALSSLFAFYAIFAKFVLHRSPQGFTALLLMLTFMTGVLLFFLGIIGEYVGRVYEESKRRPLYVIDRIVGSRIPKEDSIKTAKEAGDYGQYWRRR